MTLITDEQYIKCGKISVCFKSKMNLICRDKNFCRFFSEWIAAKTLLHLFTTVSVQDIDCLKRRTEIDHIGNCRLE